MTTILISDHAKKRIKERFNWKGKFLRKMVNRAFENGEAYNHGGFRYVVLNKNLFIFSEKEKMNLFW